MSSDNDPVPTGAEMRARAQSSIDLDRQLLDSNITAAIAASERIHWAARKKLQALGLDGSGGVAGGNGATMRLGDLLCDVKVTAPAASSGGLTEDDLHQLAVGLGNWLNPILKGIETRLAGLEQKRGLAPLAARLTQIEMNSLKYEGVWSEAKSYARGSFVTHAGSLWFAEDTSIDARPGAGSSTWKLAVKKGHAER